MIPYHVLGLGNDEPEDSTPARIRGCRSSSLRPNLVKTERSIAHLAHFRQIARLQGRAFLSSNLLVSFGCYPAEKGDTTCDERHSRAQGDPRPAPSPRPPLSALRPPCHRAARGHARGTVVTRGVALGVRALGDAPLPFARRQTDSEPCDVLVCREQVACGSTGGCAGSPPAGGTQSGARWDMAAWEQAGCN